VELEAVSCCCAVGEGDDDLAVHTKSKQNMQCEQARPEGGSRKFSRALRRLGAPPSLKIPKRVFQMAFFLTSNLHKIHFRNTVGGANDAPQTPSRMVRGHTSRFSHVDAFSVPISVYTE